MFFNYLKVSIRNILKYKVFSFINVFGLAVAMSVCMLIMLMLADQKSYDQFHKKQDRIYRILSLRTVSSQPSATSSFPVATALKANYPIVVEATRLVSGVGGDAVYNRKAVEIKGFFADAAFFKIFDFELENGNKITALTSPNTMVITSKVARQLFRDEDPIGKTIEFTDRQLSQQGATNESEPVKWGLYTITGVIADKSYKSHLKFDVLVSAASLPTLYAENKVPNLSQNWENYFSSWTYVLVQNKSTRADLAAALHDLATKKYMHLEGLKDFRLKEQRLAEISSTMVNNDILFRLPAIAYYCLGVLAFIIMLLACLNYTILSIARAVTRAKEIGIRKINGAKRKHLIFQFLSESVLTAILALLMAWLLLIFIKPAFKGLWVNKYLNFELQGNVSVYLLFVGFALLIGLIAGAFPAFYLSKLLPIKVLKNAESMLPGKLGMRKVLSVFQFIISLLFITTSLVIYNQFKHYLEFDYQFSSGNIVNVELQNNNYQKLVQEFSAVPGVSTISASNIIPATGTNPGISLKKQGSKDEDLKSFLTLNADENFIHNLDIKLIAGSNLPKSDQASNRVVLVNRATVKELGYKNPTEAIGQVLVTKENTNPLQIIGVVENFRADLPINTDKILPLLIQIQAATYKYANVKLATNNVSGTMAKLEEKWAAVDPVHPFKYEFFDEQLAASHQAIFDAVSILGSLAFLAVVIACLGMLGMATYTAERRTKEVGIRKILGAREYSIAFLLSKEFLVILSLSVVIGAPLSFVLNNLWLQNIPNRVPFGFGSVLLSSVVLLLLGLVTIVSQTYRVAKSNPVSSLRME
ncbi:ABC transporter permease [Adhaeribacter aquaticus]|uniref:ABC transporter permease n=1 Tax=Adhaeribacter aquaticus TaxID=299567 RepID=UPI0004023292|nr:ABC transporter permease [Adhaeribacter aquaticus]